MSAITIRNIDPELERRLRRRAAAAGHSIEDEVRDILRAELSHEDDAPADLYRAIRRYIEPLGGVDLPQPDRG